MRSVFDNGDLLRKNWKIEKHGEEAFKKLDNWKKRMNNSKIDKK